MELQELELPPEKDDDPMLAVMELGKGGWSESGDEIRWKHSNQLKTRMDDSKSIDETYARSSVSTLDELPCNPSIDELPCNPSQWPQRPLLVRATPNTNTRITGIRYCSGADFLDCDGFVNSGSLPINGGKELLGRSLVVEFQSSNFIGALMIRIRDAPRLERLQYQAESYFDGKKRSFQAVVRGRFETPLPMKNCLTGQVFRRPGRLPSKWIVNSFLKIFKIVAPHLEVNLGGNQPSFFAPLCATAQTVLVERHHEASTDSAKMDDTLIEPLSTNQSSILWEENSTLGNSATPISSESTASRVKRRKRFFNSVASTTKEAPSFSTDHTYVFEFYQHMLDFKDDIRIKVGKAGGGFSVAHITDGQPIKFMSAYRGKNSEDLEYLWSFDIWHESFFKVGDCSCS